MPGKEPTEIMAVQDSKLEQATFGNRTSAIPTTKHEAGRPNHSISRFQLRLSLEADRHVGAAASHATYNIACGPLPVLTG